MLKQFIRNFSKQKTVGILNICSLSLGIMVSLIIGLWTVQNLQFDNFHKNGDRIYRSILDIKFNDVDSHLTSTFKPFGEEAIAQLPNIEAMCRVVHNEESEIWIGNQVSTIDKVLVVDNNFFSFFTFPLIEGNPVNVIDTPDKVVISKTTANLLFPGKDPIGQTIKYENQDFKVSGIMKDFPRNSHIQADIVFPMFGHLAENKWGWSDVFCTYFLLRENTDTLQLTKGLTTIIRNGLDWFKLNEGTVSLQPLKDIHLGEKDKFENAVTESKSLIIVFTATAFIILILSCINFANLFVSTSFIRAKSIGIKKSQGANKAKLIKEFYTETAGYVFIAIFIGIMLAHLVLPVFNQFTTSSVEIDFSSPQLYLYIVLLFIFTTLLAGSFPAIYMTKFNIIETLSGKFRGRRISLLQKTLIVIQFTASIILLMSVTFIYKQIDFLINHDLGFNIEHIITVNSRDEFGKNFDSFRSEMMQETSITDITIKNSLPTDWVQGWTYSLPENLEKQYNAEVCRIEPNYFDFFGMKIIEGENPLYLGAADSLNICVVNETAVKIFGLTDPVGKIILPNGLSKSPITIAGVVKDAQTRSFHSPIDAQVYIRLTAKSNSGGKVLFFKIKGDPEKALKKIEQKWKATVPLVPFEYHYLDNIYRNLYKSDLNSGKVLLFAMIITIIITVAGLFAMAYYSTQRRIKEIGLRKVNGATTLDLMKLLNRDFIVWVIIAFIIALPISYFSLQEWLDDYIVKTDLDWWVFALIGILIILIALVTVSYQTWKVSTTNPVKALKND